MTCTERSISAASHPYYRHYINGTLLPSGINAFSQDIDTHFVKCVTTEIGALPANIPEGNYGIVNITTKSGSELTGGDLSVYGGTNETLQPTFPQQYVTE